MKIFTEKSCKYLCIRCIISTIILNIISYFIAMVWYNPNSLNLNLSVIILQLFCSFFLGLYIRKKNKSILDRKEKEYHIISLIVFVLLLISIIAFYGICFIVAGISLVIYNIFGIYDITNVFDFYSILICLGAVFFHKPAKGDPKFHFLYY